MAKIDDVLQEVAQARAGQGNGNDFARSARLRAGANEAGREAGLEGQFLNQLTSRRDTSEPGVAPQSTQFLAPRGDALTALIQQLVKLQQEQAAENAANPGRSVADRLNANRDALNAAGGLR